MRKKADLALSLLVLLVVVGAVWGGHDWPFKVRLFPWTIGLPATALAMVQVGLAIRNLRRAEGPEGESPEGSTPTEGAIPADVERKRAIEMSAWILAFTAGVVFFGFRVGSAVLTLAFIRIAARRGWGASLAVALSVYVFFLVVFQGALNVQLPSGWILDSLDLEWPDMFLVSLVRQVIRGM